jgi:CRISPR-associated protein Csm5
MQVGWGAGWDDKTFGMRFRVQPEELERLIRQYRLSKGNRKPGDAFPRSRRAALLFLKDPSGKRVETPARPFGWLLVTFEPLNQPAQGLL